MNLNTVFLKNILTEEELNALKNTHVSELFMNTLKKVLNARIDECNLVSMDDKNWAIKTAFMQGRLKELMYLLDMLE